MYEYHLHSHFSGDCAEQMEDIIIEAIKRGGKHICFTDHLDYDYPETDIQFEFDEEAFMKTFRELESKYGDQIQIQKGIEMGLQPHIINDCLDFNKRFKPEFVIGSFHVADRKDLFNGDFFKNRTPEEAWDIYLDEVLAILKIFKDYSVVGHLDLIKRYSEAAHHVPFEAYKDKMVLVLKQIIDDQRGIEVNVSGLRRSMNEPLPSWEIIELYYELGGEYITIGSDAHCKEDLYSHFNDTLKKLKTIGFEFFTIYENRQPKQISIERTLANC